MAREGRNVGASVRARLLSRAKSGEGDFQILLTRYALERLLYWLSQSAHRDRFILKGAMLLVTMVPDRFRPTRDLDLLGHGDNNPALIAETFREICALAVEDDGVVFAIDALAAAPIREDVDYGGVRVRTTATIDGARVPVQIDIGFWGRVTPGPMEIDYPTLLDAPAPRLRAYPVETVIAEKFEALVTLGIANSRLKDFYDLWRIAETFTLDGELLAGAIARTFDRRGTPLPTDVPIGLTDAYVETWDRQWRAFVTRERMAAAPENLAPIVSDLRAFLLPMLGGGGGVARVWRPGEGWRG